jgi:hypothetical protein
MISRISHLFLLPLFLVPMVGIVSHLPLGAEVAQAAKTNQVKLSIQPQQPRYARETWLKINVQVFGGDRKLLAGTPLLVQEIYYDSNTRRTVERTIANTVTNRNGTFTLNYQVPPEANKDKVTLVFVNPVAGGDSTSFVIPIGK